MANASSCSSLLQWISWPRIKLIQQNFKCFSRKKWIKNTPHPCSHIHLDCDCCRIFPSYIVQNIRTGVFASKSQQSKNANFQAKGCLIFRSCSISSSKFGTMQKWRYRGERNPSRFNCYQLPEPFDTWLKCTTLTNQERSNKATR